MKLKKSLALALTAVMLAGTLTACKSTGTTTGNESTAGTTAVIKSDTGESSEPGEKKVVIGVSADPETFKPYSSLYDWRYTMLCMVYQPLVLVSQNQEYKVMITGYEKVGDNVFEVSLYENIYDTAGNHFTAEDVVFSYGKAMESGNFSKLNSLVAIEALDDYTVKFTCDDTLVSGQFTLILSQIFMITQAAYEASADEMALSPVGTTGYVVDRYQAGANIIFAKSANGYWQTAKKGEEGYCFMFDTDNVDIVEYDFITESSQMAIALQTGAIDVASRISTMDLTLFEEGGEAFGTADTYELTGQHYTATFNCSEDSVCSDLNLRKALAYSWDSMGIVQMALDGMGEPATALNHNTRLDYDSAFDSWDYYDYNLETAKKYLQTYLDETGKAAGDVTITILVVNDTYLQKVAQTMQTYIMQLGVNCEVAAFDSVTRKSIRNSTEGWNIAVAKSTVTDQYLVSTMDMQFNRDKSASKAGGWVDDDTLQELLLAACKEETHTIQTVSAFEQYMKEQCYALGVCVDNVYLACDTWITELVTGPYDMVAPCASTYDWTAKK